MKRVLGGIFICFLVIAQVAQFPPSGGSGGNADTATALASNPTDCASNTYANAIAANGNLTCASITNAATTAVSTNTNSTIVLRDGSGNFAASTITGALTGNASTATALAANPTDCAAGQLATGIAANGNLTCASLFAFPTMAPVNGNFSWVNQGSASLTVESDGALFLTDSTTSGDQLRMRAAAIPQAAPWSATIAFIPLIYSTNFHVTAVFARDSGSGKVTAAGPAYGAHIRVIHATSSSAWSSVATDGAGPQSGVVKYIKVADDSTNIVFSQCDDQGGCVQFYSEGRTSFLTSAPDQYGFLVSCDSTIPVAMKVISVVTQ